MTEGFTIIHIQYRQPNHMATTLSHLVKNSVYKNRIIVVWSDPRKFNHAPAQDFMLGPDRKRYLKYGSVEEYIQAKGDWASRHNIEFVDVTDHFERAKQEFVPHFFDGDDDFQVGGERKELANFLLRSDPRVVV